jgi:hypothetical protein
MVEVTYSSETSGFLQTTRRSTQKKTLSVITAVRTMLEVIPLHGVKLLQFFCDATYKTERIHEVYT